MLEMSDKFPPVNEEQVVAFERELGRPLPPQYRQFLLLYNGGRPQKDTFVVSGADDEDIVDFFYGIGINNIYDLLENREIYESRIPEELLPIAGDPGDNQICISLTSDNYGKMYFWDHELEFTPDQAITPLADSFDEFIGSLRDYEE